MKSEKRKVKNPIALTINKHSQCGVEDLAHGASAAGSSVVDKGLPDQQALLLSSIFACFGKYCFTVCTVLSKTDKNRQTAINT